MGELSFAKQVPELIKIRELSENDVSDGLRLVFVQAANLAGIKNPISEISKGDIKKMILSRFMGLSIEEISYAFTLERYGAYDYKTEHYQLFDAEYVSSILNKYKKWLQKVRMANNLPLSQQKPPEELSDSEKEEIVKSGLKKAFEYASENNDVEPGRIYLYDYLDEKGLMPKDKATKNAVKKVAERNIQNRHKNASTREERDTFKISDALGNPTTKLITECKRISLLNFFNNYASYKQIESRL